MRPAALVEVLALAVRATTESHNANKQNRHLMPALGDDPPILRIGENALAQ
jgi:hypothetical protein